MSRDEAVEESRAKQQSKVARVIRDYELNGMGDELVANWTENGDDQSSLRELAVHLNQTVLRAAMETAGMSPLDGEVENIYRLLTDGETSAGSQVEAETALSREGVAVDELEQDFVSHQAIHTYLTKYRDVEWRSQTDDEDRVAKTVGVVQRLQSRLTTVSERSLRKLRDAGRISLGDFDVLVDVRVFCEDCGTQRDIVDLLTEGGCGCER